MPFRPALSPYGPSRKRLVGCRRFDRYRKERGVTLAFGTSMLAVSIVGIIAWAVAVPYAPMAQIAVATVGLWLGLWLDCRRRGA